MRSGIVQADYDALEAVAQRFEQQAYAIGELRGRLQRSGWPLEQGGWQGRGSAAFFGELNAQLLPATQRLRLALDEARAVTLEIRALLQQAEQEAAAPFRSRAAGTNGLAGDGQAAATQTTEPEGPSGVLIAAGLAADLTPVVGELKGLAEIFTGKDLVTGEELGWWRFAGILGVVGLNEVKLLRHGGKVADAARGALRSGARQGLEATATTIAHGTVRMELHPDYPRVVEELNRAGYSVKHSITNHPYVEVVEVVNPAGVTLRTEKAVRVLDGMRYLDLEHELGHVQQLTQRLNHMPTRRVVELPDGTTKKAKNEGGVLTTWQNAITEYHNRLGEYLRLHERGVEPELLREHFNGLTTARKEYVDKGLNRYFGSKQPSWAKQHFPDIEDLEKRIHELAE